MCGETCGELCDGICDGISGEICGAICDEISECLSSWLIDTRIQKANKRTQRPLFNAAEVAKQRSHPHDVTVTFTVTIKFTVSHK